MSRRRREVPYAERPGSEPLLAVVCPCCYGLGVVGGVLMVVDYAGARQLSGGPRRADASMEMCNDCNRAAYMGGSHPHPLARP